MRYLLASLLVLTLSSLCRSEEAKLNTLTPKEIAESWILLFDGETTYGWDAIGKPTVRGGVLSYDVSDDDVRASLTTAFRQYEVKFEYLIEKTVKDAAPVTWQPINHSEFAIPLDTHKGWASASFEVKDDGIRHEANPKNEGKRDISANYLTFTPKHRFTSQKLTFGIPKGNRLSLRNVRLKPLDTKPLFNGKDLSGWKQLESEFKRVKSQFSVTKEGWLNIQNGPGDLQTTGAWADFVLQLDCRTNGDNLNSGVFFRCIPGQYQRGYEAQIQNQKAKEPKKYTIEEYDPKSHKLVNKKEIQNWSQDYGTGAIYRRIPARRSAAKDREWFTMTVVAHGRHLATWVNGIQMADWTDNRPENDNPRNGCRVKKGAISLQGHDPTTDLNFRNIRIADLEAKD